jgi:hypothetical protein
VRVKTYDLSNRIIFVHSQSRDTIPLTIQDRTPTTENAGKYQFSKIRYMTILDRSQYRTAQGRIALLKEQSRA